MRQGERGGEGRERDGERERGRGRGEREGEGVRDGKREERVRDGESERMRILVPSQTKPQPIYHLNLNIHHTS